MTDEREAELRRLASQYERCDFVRDLREHGGTRFSFHDALIEALDAVRELKARHEEHLKTIVRITRETPYPEELDECLRQRAALIAEVGTLKARLTPEPPPSCPRRPRTGGQCEPSRYQPAACGWCGRLL